MATVNFTVAVDCDLLKRGRVIAAKAETSVNALFIAELRYLVETFELAEACGNGPEAGRTGAQQDVALRESQRRRIDPPGIKSADATLRYRIAPAVGSVDAASVTDRGEACVSGVFPLVMSKLSGHRL